MEPVGEALENFVAAGQLPGATVLAWRKGREPQSVSVGRRDLAADLPMQRDTLFRIASVSKAMTSVTALSLFDEGRFTLDEPITPWAPEFAHVRVLRTPGGALRDTVAAERPITFQDLLTHRAGLTYADFQTGDLARAYRDALGAAIDSDRSPDDWIAALASLPLVSQPGAAFHYSHATDLLGLLIARMEGQTLGEVMRERLFAPLGMVDTGFSVPADQRRRCARMYGFDDAGRMTERPTGSGDAFLAERPRDMTFESGGQGLWSTADDILRFARIFTGAGEVDAVRILKPETVRLMTRNHLTQTQRAEARMLGMPIFGSHGFGLGVAVVLNPTNAPATLCRGAAGTVGWPGAYGAWWQADPEAGSVMVFLTHNTVDLAQMGQGLGLAVYAAIEQFHALATEAMP